MRGVGAGKSKGRVFQVAALDFHGSQDAACPAVLQRSFEEGITVTIKDALYHCVHDFAAGVGALAARMRLAESTLYAMANPNDATHEWSLRRFVDLLSFTADMRPLEALCDQFGGVFIKTAPMGDVADRDLYELATRLGVEFGDVVRTMSDVLDEHGEGGSRVTPREMAEFDRQIYELQACAAELRERLSTRVGQRPNLAVAKKA